MSVGHYQFDEGLAWADAMAQLTKRVSSETDQTDNGEDRAVLGLNDRGEAVRGVQEKLAQLGFLAEKEVDGVFGAVTRSAVHAFQLAHKLDADGLVGKQTSEKLFALK